MSDEITVRVEDSAKDSTNYWNLRKTGYKEQNYRSQLGNRRQEDPDNKREEGIRIDFNMNESRNITERQKEVILQTLIGKDPEDFQTVETYRNRWMDNSIPLMSLLAFFVAALILLLLLIGGQSCY